MEIEGFKKKIKCENEVGKHVDIFESSWERIQNHNYLNGD